MKILSEPLEVQRHHAKIEDFLYIELNEFSYPHPLLGRVLALPLAIEDGLAPIFTSAIYGINCVALVPIHLLGAAFSSKNHTVKKSILLAKIGLLSLTNIPVLVIMSPIKAIYQIFVLIINPRKAGPFRVLNW